MLTVQNDWIEYETEPVPARRVAVRGGAACAQRAAGPGVVTGAPAARPTSVRQPARAAAARPEPARRLRPEPARRLRLTRRGRVVLVLLPSLLVVSGLLLAAAPGVAEAAQPQATRTFVVGTGDTLWTIAERIAPDADPRATIAAIQRANDLHGSGVAAGEVLRVPAGR